MGGAGGVLNVSDSLLHFGSVYGEFDYESTNSVLYAGLNFKVNSKLKFWLQGNYSKSEAAFDKVEMNLDTPEVHEALEEIEASDYDYSGIPQYSDLSYGFMNFKARAEYQLSNRLVFNVDFDYYDFTSDEAWVYGDESGSLYVFKTGFKLINLGK
ncbi:MAG: hypothetical protein DWQ05_02255 [Calditrichaeota bacterium]|nr:MAG: hypothetical protein DWQ05_02255 [Calditrichota bacterium]